MFEDFTDFLRKIYGRKKIPLHEPIFKGNEKKYLNQCIDTTYVSTIGEFVNKLENKIAKYTGANYAITTCNGTSALHTCLKLAEVSHGHEVITQALNFIATSNAISYCGAEPIFLDVDQDTMGLSPNALRIFLKNNTIIKNNNCINKTTNKVIKACVPMHSYGHPCRIDEIRSICDKHFIFLIEDAAESVGSYYKDKHTGTFGHLGALSFNGNKIITAGGGGCILTNDKVLAKKAKHLTTTAKINHKWNFGHDEIGYNYRMPNLNAALLFAQFENLDFFVMKKRELAAKYETFVKNKNYNFFKEPKNCKSNYWLNCIIFKDRFQRDQFLELTNSSGVVTRPIWTLMNQLPMFKSAQTDQLKHSEWLFDRVVNIPSSSTL